MEHPDGGEVSVDEYTRIDVDRPADGVAWIEMDRPEMRNAQDTRMLAELDDAFETADRDPAVDCIVLAGAGSDFSAGHDLSDSWDDPLNAAFWEHHDESIEEQLRVEREFFYDHTFRIRDTDTPTVASVQGNCVLAGIMLADACDLVVASEDAQFVNPSLRHVGTGAEVLMLPWSIGVRKTKELLWTGDPLLAPDAKDLGLVNRVVPSDDLADETLYLARRVALNPTVSLQVTKEVLNNALDQMGMEDAMRYHFALHQLVHHSAEGEEWHAEADERQAEGGFGAWLEFRDGPFEDLAEEYGKDNPRVT
ncbi:MAG: enoyl-CoA hydratase [Salinirussus sp.]